MPVLGKATANHYGAILLILLLISACSGSETQKRVVSSDAPGEGSGGETFESGTESNQVSGAALVKVTLNGAAIRTTVSAPAADRIKITSDVLEGDKTGEVLDDDLKITWKIPFNPLSKTPLRVEECEFSANLLQQTCTLYIQADDEYGTGFVLKNAKTNEQRVVVVEITRDLTVHVYYAGDETATPKPTYWNYYVKEIGINNIHDPCDPDNDTNCIAAFIKRETTIDGLSSCASIDAYDNLAAFSWNCQIVGDHINVAIGDFLPGKGLKDLLEEIPAAEQIAGQSNFRWRNNYVVVSGIDPASGLAFTRYSDLENWWNNDVANLPVSTNAVADLSAPYTIYVSKSRSASGYEIHANGIGLVVLNDQKLTYNGVETCLEESDYNWLGLDVPCFVGVANSFFWLEGHFDGAANIDSVVGIWRPVFGRVHGSVFERGDVGLHVGHGPGYQEGAWASLFHDIAITDVEARFSDTGIKVVYYNKLTFRGITAAQNTLGVDLGAAGDVLISQSMIANNVDGLSSASPANVFQFQVVYANNEDDGVINSNTTGYSQAITTINNGGDGIYDDGIVIREVASISNADNGFRIGNATSYNLVSANNVVSQIFFNGAVTNSFKGYLGVSNEGSWGGCRNTLDWDGGTDSGNTSNLRRDGSGNCIESPPDPNLFLQAGISIPAGTTFFGNLAAGDPKHSNYADVLANGNNGFLAVGSIKNYGGFSYFWRTWDKGYDPVSTLNRGACTSGNCTMVDYGLKSTDTYLRNKVVDLTTQDANSDGIDDDCPTTQSYEQLTFWGATILNLKGTIEIVHDNKGNDNQFCESNEDCLLTRNVGAYQGHGDFVASSTQAHGCPDIGTKPGGCVNCIEHVRLFEYENNGF